MELEGGNVPEKNFGGIEGFLLGIGRGGREIVSERMYLVMEEKTMLAVKAAKDPLTTRLKIVWLCKYLPVRSINFIFMSLVNL